MNTRIVGEKNATTAKTRGSTTAFLYRGLVSLFPKSYWTVTFWGDVFLFRGAISEGRFVRILAYRGRELLLVSCPEKRRRRFTRPEEGIRRFFGGPNPRMSGIAPLRAELPGSVPERLFRGKVHIRSSSWVHEEPDFSAADSPCMQVEFCGTENNPYFCHTFFQPITNTMKYGETKSICQFHLL